MCSLDSFGENQEQGIRVYFKRR